MKKNKLDWKHYHRRGRYSPGVQPMMNQDLLLQLDDIENLSPKPLTDDEFNAVFADDTQRVWFLDIEHPLPEDSRLVIRESEFMQVVLRSGNITDKPVSTMEVVETLFPAAVRQSGRPPDAVAWIGPFPLPKEKICTLLWKWGSRYRVGWTPALKARFQENGMLER